MTINVHARAHVERLVAPVGRGLADIGLSANVITAAGVVLTAAAAGLVVVDRVVIAALVLLVGSLADAFDGPVARARGTSSPAGGFYDSVADRVGDGLVIGAIAWHYADEPLLFAVSMTALVAAQLTSYIRAKGESLDVECSVGLLERGERAFILIGGLLVTWLLPYAMWILAVGGLITVVQRFVHVGRRLSGPGVAQP